ncbi:methanogenesis marker 16 metalloprotein [Methanobrevibacter sp.]
MPRTIEEINQKIQEGDVQVYSALDFKQAIKNDETIPFEEVDIVTCGTCGVMSGTSAIFNIIVDEPGSFKKAKRVFLNGIEAQVGPCPNEWLGSIDCILNGTAHSKDIEGYGGGFLIHDLLKGREIDIEVEDIDGKIIKSKTTLDEIVTAQMIGTRNAFKNYTAFVNPGDNPVSSIFYAKEMETGFDKISFSGCGDINPLQNDPNRIVINQGMNILLNGAEGLVLGQGTRSSNEKPNLMLSANIKEMDSHYVGGYKTGLGPEIYDSVAIPIPVLNEEIYNNLLVLNEDIPIPVSDIHGRHLPISQTDYAKLWDNHSKRPKYDEDKCIACVECFAEKYCPTNAIKHMIKNNKISIEFNSSECFGCGVCAEYCVGNVFIMNTGSLTINHENTNHNLKITSRQSDKVRASDIINELNDKILSGDFKL